MTSPLHSQKVLNDTCCVPCQALRNALVVKSEKELLEKKLKNARDTISTYSQTLKAKDTLITARDSSIAVYVRNEGRHAEIINNKDSIITTYGQEIQNQKNQKIGAIIALVLTVLTWTLTSL